MKLFKITLALLVATLFFNACQKEYSVEKSQSKGSGSWEFTDSANTYKGNMDSAYIISSGITKQLHLDGTSSDGSQHFFMVLYADSFQVGTYKASLFQCSFVYTTNAKTIYQASELIGEFIVDVSSISSSSIVGTFSGTAEDSTNALKNITLGKFTANFNTDSSATISSGVLGDSSGNCKPVVINGIYKQGVATTDSNTVQVQVTVAEAGSYTITTNNVDGIIFGNTGTFNSTGIQNVLLYAGGTPLAAGNQVYTLKYGNSQCAFTLSVSP